MRIGRRTAFVLLALSLGACSRSETGEGSDKAEPSHSYQVRGLVKAVRLDKKATTLSIEHEAIPSWVNRQGQKVGMMSMTMDFVAAPKLDVGAIKAGDKIAFDLDVYYGEDSRLEITSIEELPPDTALEIAGQN